MVQGKRSRGVAAYCMRCKMKQKVTQVTITRTQRGDYVLIGSCICCGTKIWRFCSPEEFVRQDGDSLTSGATEERDEGQDIIV